MNPNKILLVIDCQNDFITGSLAVQGAEDIAKRLTTYIERNWSNYSAIVYTLDSHPYNHCSFVEQGGQWPTHCIMLSEGWMLYPDLRELIENINLQGGFAVPIYKGMSPNQEEYSAIANKENIDIFKAYSDGKEIDVCGIMSEYCVHDTVEAICKLKTNPTVPTYDQRVRLLTDLIVTTDNHAKLKTLLTKYPNIKFVNNSFSEYTPTEANQF